MYTNTHVIYVCFAGLAKQEGNQFLCEAILILQNDLVKEWFTFGLHLGLGVAELNVIECNSQSYVDKRTCVRQMLIKWKDIFDEKATWEKIVIALRKIGSNALAQKVEETFVSMTYEKHLKIGINILPGTLAHNELLIENHYTIPL